MAQKVKEHPEAIEQWKEVLDAGGTKNPVELAALAGIDISNADALKETVSFITFLVDEIERLTEKLEESKER
jgi:oligoendopeptidase F